MVASTATYQRGRGSVTESTSGESKAQADDEVVPKKQFIAALGNVSKARDEALAKAAALELKLAEATKAKTEQKPPTRAELKQFVEKGELSQEEADMIMENQIVANATKAATEAATRTIAGVTYQQTVEAELAAYHELKSAAWEEGTPEYARAKQEFDYLVKLGDPNSRVTELKALRAAFGDIPTLRASLQVRRGPSDTHRETGGRGRQQSSGEGDVIKSLSAEKREYYERQIDKGQYKDWDAVKAELTYNPRK